eukprot:SAG22_NODE_6779_length_812_cov_1.007013_1_plen_95_part_00
MYTLETNSVGRILEVRSTASERNGQGRKMADPGVKEKETEILELQQEVKRLREVEQEYNDTRDKLHAVFGTQPYRKSGIACIPVAVSYASAVAR